MRVPLVYTPTEIVKWPVSEECSLGLWRPARPCGFSFLSWDCLKMRLRITWRVFTGKYDALNWQGTGVKRNTETNYRDCTEAGFKLVNP